MKREPLICTNCFFETPWGFALDSHLKSYHKPKAPEILHCRNKIDSYVCCQCGYTTDLKTDISRHSKEDHKFEILDINLALLENNIKGSRNKIKKFRCSICKSYTFSQFLASAHIIRRHSNSAAGKAFECEHCHFKTKYVANYRRHLIYLHSNNFKMQKCTICFKEIRRAQDYKKHIEDIHNRGFIRLKIRCELCAYQGTQKNLRQHMKRVHLDQITVSGVTKNVYCEHCPHKATNRENLKRHVIDKHSEFYQFKWFNCEHCDYKTKFRGDFREHFMMRHTCADSAIWFDCAHCSYKTKKKSHLNRHLRRKYSCGMKC